MVGRPYRPHDSRRARSTSPAVGVVRAPVAGPAFRATSSESRSTTVTIADAGTENCLTALEEHAAALPCDGEENQEWELAEVGGNAVARSRSPSRAGAWPARTSGASRS